MGLRLLLALQSRLTSNDLLMLNVVNQMYGYDFMQVIRFSLAVILLYSVIFSSVAQEQLNKPFLPTSVSLSRVATGPVSDGDGNELQRDQWMFEVKTVKPLDRHWSIGAKLAYDYFDYDVFSSSIESQHAVETVERYRASLSLSYRLDKHWMFIFSPQLQYAASDTVSLSDAQSYGAFLSTLYHFNSGNMIGLGVGYVNDIDETRTVPFIAINWMLTDTLKLANPLSAGFSGPAGLELSYINHPNWDYGIGIANRTNRFLVADEQTAEIDEWVGFGRVSWKANSTFSVNVYAGYFFNGDLEFNSPYSNENESIDNQSAFALAVIYNF